MPFIASSVSPSYTSALAALTDCRPSCRAVQKQGGQKGGLMDLLGGADTSLVDRFGVSRDLCSREDGMDREMRYR